LGTVKWFLWSFLWGLFRGFLRPSHTLSTKLSIAETHAFSIFFVVLDGVSYSQIVAGGMGVVWVGFWGVESDSEEKIEKNDNIINFRRFFLI